MNQTNVKVSFYLKKSESDADGYCPVMANWEILGVCFQHEAEGAAEDVGGRPGYGQERGG